MGLSCVLGTVCSGQKDGTLSCGARGIRKAGQKPGVDVPGKVTSESGRERGQQLRTWGVWFGGRVLA